MTLEKDPGFKGNILSYLGVSPEELELCSEAISEILSGESDEERIAKKPRVEDPPTSRTEAANGSTAPPDNPQTPTLNLEGTNVPREQPQKEQFTQQGKGHFMVKAEPGSGGNESVSNFMRTENPQVSNTSAAGGFGGLQQLPVTHRDFIRMMKRLDHLSDLVKTQMKEVRHLTQVIKTFMPEVLEIPQWQPFAVPYNHQSYQNHPNFQHHPTYQHHQSYQHHPQAFPVLPVANSSGIGGFSVSSSLNQQDILKAKHS